MPTPIKSVAMATMFGLIGVLLFAALACGGAATPETIIVEKEVVKEVIKEVVVEKEIIKEVPKEVVVEKVVIKEVTKVVVVTPTLEPVKTQLFVLSNSSPHVSVIDTETNRVIRTADIPGFTPWTWTWIDNNNYFDGTNLWVGIKDPDTTDVEVVKLNLDTLEFTGRLPIGKDKNTLYIGKPGRNGVVHVGKMGSGQVVAIDIKDFKVLNTWDVPVNGDVVCDADVVVGSDGVERFYYPTRKGGTLVSINAETGETIKITEAPEGTQPFMLSAAPDGNIWVQERGSNTSAVYDPVTLELVKRFPVGKVPIDVTFSPDGKYGYIGHAGDAFVQVVDTQTFEEVKRITVGTNPRVLAAHPNGKYLYTIVHKEASVAVIDTGSWAVTERIDLGTAPRGIYLLAGS
ncbi:MAG: hypothetical protein IH962_01190 [Chloroflexi bacterium]|nr:hypothetical protein [Chloroflexota bacterium]